MDGSALQHTHRIRATTINMEMKAFSITHQESGSTARISLFGGTIISYKNKGSETLFLSQKAKLDGTKAIRGGIPPCFPVFGKAQDGPCKDLPQHGFARTHLWRIQEQKLASATITLVDDELSDEAKGQWPYQFKVEYTISLENDGKLECSFKVINTGHEAFAYQVLLHTYFKVNDIADVKVEGLNGVEYTDKVLSSTSKQLSSVTCTGETDRVYHNVSDQVSIHEPSRSIVMDRTNLHDVVVWNPWINCHKMPDFGPDDGYKQMICVEAGAVSKSESLKPGESSTHGQVITPRL